MPEVSCCESELAQVLVLHSFSLMTEIFCLFHIHGASHIDQALAELIKAILLPTPELA